MKTEVARCIEGVRITVLVELDEAVLNSEDTS